MHRLILPCLLALGLLSAASPGHAASGDHPAVRKQQKRISAPNQQAPLARPRPAVSCAEFGAGFVRMPGSDSCVRLNGSVGLGVGGVP
jgi:hypothetical protein